VTFVDTDDKGRERRRMSYTPCMSFADREMMPQ